MKNNDKQRDSFILYKSHYEPISKLSDSQLGRLFRAIFQWQINGKADPGPDIEMAFGFIINQCRIDNEKYLARCEKNQENGKLGGRPKKTDRLLENQTVIGKPKKPYNENENGNGNGNYGKAITDINDVYKD